MTKTANIPVTSGLFEGGTTPAASGSYPWTSSAVAARSGALQRSHAGGITVAESHVLDQPQKVQW
jgi:hypothetical protein